MTGASAAPRNVSAGAQLKIGIVVVSYNGIGFTRACLRSLAHVTYPRTVVAVVDNASTDGTANAVRSEFPWAELLVLSENRGFTGGNNAGIEWCLAHGCDAVLVQNNDTRVEPDYLEHMAPHAAAGRIVGPEIRSLEDPARINDEISYFDWQKGVALPASRPPRPNGIPLPARITSGCCFLVPRAVFERIGFLDDNFFIYFEEVDFQVRAQLAGFQIVTEPNAVVYHREEVAPGVRLSPFRAYYGNRNRLYIMRKHGRFDPRFLAYYAATRTAHAARFLARGELRLLASMARGVRDYALGRMGRFDHAW